MNLHLIGLYLKYSLGILSACHYCPLQGGRHSVSQGGKPVVGWQGELSVLPVALLAGPAAALGPRVGRLAGAGVLEGLGRRGGLGGLRARRGLGGLGGILGPANLGCLRR